MSATGIPGVPERPVPGVPQGPVAGVPERPVPGVPPSSDNQTPTVFDPLKLCIFATVALLAWVFGPFAVLVFAGMGLVGYWRARQAGLTRSKCYLRDTRLVLIYLTALIVASLVAIALLVQRLFS